MFCKVLQKVIVYFILNLLLNKLVKQPPHMSHVVYDVSYGD